MALWRAHPSMVSECDLILDPQVRAAEKQASRDRDAADLASGVKTREQLWIENTMLPARFMRIDILSIPLPD